MSYPGLLFGESYLSAEMQWVYLTASADWVKKVCVCMSACVFLLTVAIWYAAILIRQSKRMRTRNGLDQITGWLFKLLILISSTLLFHSVFLLHCLYIGQQTLHLYMQRPPACCAMKWPGHTGVNSVLHVGVASISLGCKDLRRVTFASGVQNKRLWTHSCFFSM